MNLFILGLSCSYGHAKHRDDEYVGRKVLEMQSSAREKKTGNTKDEVSVCVEGGHAGGRTREDEVFGCGEGGHAGGRGEGR